MTNEINQQQILSMQTQLKLLQDENRQLKQDLSIQRANNKQDSNSNKNLLNEMVCSYSLNWEFKIASIKVKVMILQLKDSMRQKFQSMQEENNNLRRELSEKQKQLSNGNYYNLDLIQSQNEALKHDIEIMKIKLKQFEHMQQLTLMLQESHK